jgi:hypothetical protein
MTNLARSVDLAFYICSSSGFVSQPWANTPAERWNWHFVDKTNFKLLSSLAAEKAKQKVEGR